MNYEAEGTEEYLQFVNLRNAVLEGNATEDERQHYFYELEHLILNLGIAAATVAIEHNVSGLQGCGRELAVHLDALLAVGTGRPGPIMSSMIRKAKFDNGGPAT